MIDSMSFCLFDMIRSFDLICEVFGLSPGDPCGKGGLGDWMRSEVKCAGLSFWPGSLW